MRIVTKIAAIFSFVSIVGLPLLATGNYAITETEESNRVNPLDILSGRAGHNSDQNRLKIVKKKSLKRAGKHTLRRNKNLQKVIYLTFDDGPGKGTANVIRVLREEGIEGTLFFIGRKIEKNRALYNQALSMPNLLIANHTYSHANGKYENFYNHISTVVNDVDRAQTIIGGAKYLRLAGRNVWRLPRIYRGDYGLSKTRRSIESPKYTALSNRGYQIYGWDIEWRFDHSTGNPSYGADQMASRIAALYRRQSVVKPGKIVLLAHDYMFRTQSGLQKLRELVQILKADAWKFETISDFSKSTPAVFVRRKSHPQKKVIRIAMSKKGPMTADLKKQKRLLDMLR